MAGCQLDFLINPKHHLENTYVVTHEPLEHYAESCFFMLTMAMTLYHCLQPVADVNSRTPQGEAYFKQCKNINEK